LQCKLYFMKPAFGLRCIEERDGGWVVAIRKDGVEQSRRWYPGATKTDAMHACFKALCAEVKQPKQGASR
jgi:hypothetical protein